jgi:dihydroneopterin aldolase
MSREEQAPAIARSTLFVRGLRVDARVGVHLHERKGHQPLIVDLEIDIRMPSRDDILATLDYVTAADMVRRSAISRHFELIETFARHVGEEFLTIDRVRQVLIRVTKPLALAESTNATGVELVLKRQKPRRAHLAMSAGALVTGR